MTGKYKSHLYSFFGSDAAKPNTTTSAELQAGCTTAYNPKDLSSYCKLSKFKPESHEIEADGVSKGPALFYVDGSTYAPVPSTTSMRIKSKLNLPKSPPSKLQIDGRKLGRNV